MYIAVMLIVVLVAIILLSRKTRTVEKQEEKIPDPPDNVVNNQHRAVSQDEKEVSAGQQQRENHVEWGVIPYEDVLLSEIYEMIVIDEKLTSMIGELGEISRLYHRGFLTDNEFFEQKDKLFRNQ